MCVGVWREGIPHLKAGADRGRREEVVRSGAGVTDACKLPLSTGASD